MKKAVCPILAALLALLAVCPSAGPYAAAARASEIDVVETIEEDDGESGAQVRYAAKQINLYKKKSTSSKKLCKIEAGEAVSQTSTSGNWAYVTYTDASGTDYTGYVKKANLSKTPTVTPTPTPEPSDPEETPDPDATPEPSPTPSFPGGGGSRPNGAGGGSGAKTTPSPMDLLGITPGKAVSSGHKKGSYDDTPYGAVALSVSGSAMEALKLGGMALDVALTGDEGEAAFSTRINKQDGEVYLLLTPADSFETLTWHVGGSALRTLSSSGVKHIVLAFGDGRGASVATANLFSGVQYDRLRASGITDGAIDMTLAVSGGEISVCAWAEGICYEASVAPNKVFCASGLKAGDLDTVISDMTDTDEEG